VLFCKLTPEQRDVYRAYLASSDVEEIFSGRRQALQGIDILRKICNHPDLLDRAVKQHATDYGAPHASGKLTVTAKVATHGLAQYESHIYDSYQPYSFHIIPISIREIVLKKYVFSILSTAKIAEYDTPVVCLFICCDESVRG
jgi:hypothetical protein